MLPQQGRGKASALREALAAALALTPAPAYLAFQELEKTDLVHWSRRALALTVDSSPQQLNKNKVTTQYVVSTAASKFWL